MQKGRRNLANSCCFGACKMTNPFWTIELGHIEGKEKNARSRHVRLSSMTQMSHLRALQHGRGIGEREGCNTEDSPKRANETTVPKVKARFSYATECQCLQILTSAPPRFKRRNLWPRSREHDMYAQLHRK